MDDQTDVLVIGGGATGTGIAETWRCEASMSRWPSEADCRRAPRAVTRTAPQRRSLRRGRREGGAGVPRGKPHPPGHRWRLYPRREVVRATGRRRSGLLRGEARRLRGRRDSDRRDRRGERSRSSPGPRRGRRTGHAGPGRGRRSSRLVAANAVDASEHGARVRTHAPVTSMTVEDDRATAVTLGGDAGERDAPAAIRGERDRAHAGRVVGDGRRLRFDATDTGRHGLGRIRRPRAGGKSLSQSPTMGTSSSRTTARSSSGRRAFRSTIRTTTSGPTGRSNGRSRSARRCSRRSPRASAFERGGASARCTNPTRPLAAAAASRGGSTCSEHADEDVENCCSVVGGKLTTYRRMARRPPISSATGSGSTPM